MPNCAESSEVCVHGRSFEIGKQLAKLLLIDVSIGFECNEWRKTIARWLLKFGRKWLHHFPNHKTWCHQFVYTIIAVIWLSIPHFRNRDLCVIKLLLFLTAMLLFCYLLLVRAGVGRPMQHEKCTPTWYHSNNQFSLGLLLNGRTSGGRRRVLHVFKYATE